MLKFRSRKNAAALFVVFVSALLIFIFFYRHVTEANQVSFATGGDGFKSTFGSLYHIKHDTSYWYTWSMNYPYGESVFFTGNQVFATNLIKALKDVGLDLSDYTLGILNIWMLFSFVLCALLLYLIFRELGVPDWYAVVPSLIITFLSPQLERFGGHYNLAYAWVFPLAIYMMIRFHRKPSWYISVAFGVFVLIICGKQLYYLALVGVLWLVFCIYMMGVSKKRGDGLWSLVPHFLVQLIIPFIIFNLFSGMYDVNADRTAYPWGFFPSTTRLESIFLPLGKPYGQFIHLNGSWRTVAYVGLVSTVSLLIIMIAFVWRWIRDDFRRALRVSDAIILNVFFLGAIIALLISLGYPFQLGLQKWLNYMGPLRQFRAIGRFVFPFYYVMNILAFYLIWIWYARNPKLWRSLVLLAALSWGAYDAWLNIDYVRNRYYRKFTTLNDRANQMEENRWVLRHDWSDYQAIMPLPYFHIGSENYWYGDHSPVIEQAFIASIKTGLPLNAVMLSRTSISQTLGNLDIWFEPYHEYPALSNYKSGKPLLLLQARNGVLSENEKNLLDQAVLIDSSRQTFFYEYYPDSLTGMLRENESWLKHELEQYNDSVDRGDFVFESYQDRPSGEFRADIIKKGDFFSCEFPDTGKYTVSFWFRGTGDDLWPRTNYFIKLADAAGSTYSYRQSDFFRQMVLRDGDWGLVEFPLDVKQPGSALTLSYHNRYLPRGEVAIDNVLVRPAGSKIRVFDGEQHGINNRFLISR